MRILLSTWSWWDENIIINLELVGWEYYYQPGVCGMRILLSTRSWWDENTISTWSWWDENIIINLELVG